MVAGRKGIGPGDSWIHGDVVVLGMGYPREYNCFVVGIVVLIIEYSNSCYKLLD